MKDGNDWMIAMNEGWQWLKDCNDWIIAVIEGLQCNKWKNDHTCLYINLSQNRLSRRLNKFPHLRKQNLIFVKKVNETIKKTMCSGLF